MTERMTAAQFKKNKDLSEYEEQIKLAEYLDMNGFCWNHVPNGGNRDARTGAKMKRQGTKKGFPDVQIFDVPEEMEEVPGYMLSGIVIELKRRNGNPSDVRKEQQEWLRKLGARNWITKVAFGADDAINWLEGLEW